MNKRGVEYVWLFSIIVGAIIIFLAIFTAQRYTETATIGSQAELTRQFDILLNPFASIGSITTMTLSKEIKMPTDVQMRFSCDANENYNELFLRTKRIRGWENWPRSGFKIRDKYLFAEELEGRNLWIFSKPFEMPWRVDDLIFITDKNYCFEDAPENIVREIDSLRTAVIANKGGCAENSIEVCFGIRSCDINVNYQLGIVKKDRKSIVFFGDALMYAAILSDSDTYECNFNRLINRIRTQIDINIRKAVTLEVKGCNTKGIQSSLASMKSVFEGRLVGNFESIAEEVDNRNPKECPVF